MIWKLPASFGPWPCFTLQTLTNLHKEILVLTQSRVNRQWCDISRSLSLLKNGRLVENINLIVFFLISLSLKCYGLKFWIFGCLKILHTYTILNLTKFMHDRFLNHPIHWLLWVTCTIIQNGMNTNKYWTKKLFPRQNGLTVKNAKKQKAENQTQYEFYPQ